jgi:hypothetical protein
MFSSNCTSSEYRLLTTVTVPNWPRTRGDRDLPSSLNLTRSPTLNFGALKDNHFFACSTFSIASIQLTTNDATSRFKAFSLTAFSVQNVSRSI